MVHRKRMSAEITMRPLCSDDASCAAVLEQAEHDGWSEESIRTTLARENTCCWAAQTNGVLAGFCICDTVLDEASLYAVTVAPAFRRHGVGAALLRHLFLQLTERGVHTLFLEVRSKNVPALALYEKLGFAQIGLRRNFYSAPPDDAVLMQKSL